MRVLSKELPHRWLPARGWQAVGVLGSNAGASGVEVVKSNVLSGTNSKGLSKCLLRGGVHGECPPRSWISTTKFYSSPKTRHFLLLLLPPPTSTPRPVGHTSWREWGRRGRSTMWENKSVVPCPSHIGLYLFLLISGSQPESALPGKGEKGEVFA